MEERVVVGVDGSAEADVALDWAADEAARRGARLQVVSVAQEPELWAVPYGLAPPLPTTPLEFPDIARAAAQEALDGLARRHPELARSVRAEVVGLVGHPAAELVDHAAGAAVLVLGHRGRGTLASAALGSVGLSCVLHARCPVTVVRPPVAGVPAAG